ncbi:aldo/keto reductase [Pseudolysinimonas kribbensis]|uniref:aldo/keto reductase n=1 Tax=Pseudolysinimonas kribbensis TaxID=433641 RepID=UPI0031E1C439
MSGRLPDRELGSTGLVLSSVTLGGGPLGSMLENFGYEVAEEQAIELVGDVLRSEIRTIDTANGYSAGRSERRIGTAIARFGLPDDVVVVTKVDADGRDYSGDRVRASLRESRERLGLPGPLPLVHLHDPEFHDFADLTALGGAVDALVEARESGAVSHIGLAGGRVQDMRRYLDLGVFDVLLVHNRWTLVDRSGGDLIDDALERGVGVVNAAVFGGGILADDSGRATGYGYRPAPPATLKAITAMRDACTRWSTDLRTAALRFSTRDPRFASTIVGISKPERVEPTIAAASADLPDGLWEELESLLPPRAHWLDYRD